MPERTPTQPTRPMLRLGVAEIRKTATLNFDDERWAPMGYPGGRVVVWTNPPQSVIEELTQPGTKLTGSVLHILQEWNLADAEGVPLPLTLDGVAQAPNDLLRAIDMFWWEQMALPLPSAYSLSTSTPPAAVPARNGSK